MATAPARALENPSSSADAPRPFGHEEPTAEEIAAEAYMIYVARGHVDGYDLDDWLEAERVLRQQRAESSR
jgi:hypothetical protein